MILWWHFIVSLALELFENTDCLHCRQDFLVNSASSVFPVIYGNLFLKWKYHCPLRLASDYLLVLNCIYTSNHLRFFHLWLGNLLFKQTKGAPWFLCNVIFCCVRWRAHTWISLSSGINKNLLVNEVDFAFWWLVGWNDVQLDIWCNPWIVG